MIEEGEDELICDLAETYRIYDYKQLPIKMVAIFAWGLPQDARIMRKLSNDNYSTEEKMLIKIFDCVNWLVWSRTEDGANNRNKPEQLFDKLYKIDRENKQVESFETGDEFQTEWRRRIMWQQ